VPPQTGATTEPRRGSWRELVRRASQVIVAGIDVHMRREQEDIDAVELDAVDDALAVRSIMVSRSMNGSPSAEPLPTTPGQVACGVWGRCLAFCESLMGSRFFLGFLVWITLSAVTCRIETRCKPSGFLSLRS